MRADKKEGKTSINEWIRKNKISDRCRILEEVITQVTSRIRCES